MSDAPAPPDLAARLRAISEAEWELPPLRRSSPEPFMRAMAAHHEERMRDPRVRAAIEEEQERRLEQLCTWVRRLHGLE